MNTNEKTFPPILSAEDDKEENLYFSKLEWLKEQGREITDVMQDEEGIEYILEPTEDGEMHKVELPTAYQGVKPIN